MGYLTDLFTDSVSYLRFLNESYNVHVHGLDACYGKYMYHFMPYNVHVEPFCLYMKNISYSNCLKMQKLAINHAKEGPYYGMCCFGMSEFVFPISLDEKQNVIGIICVSGYSNPETADISFMRLHEAAKRLQINTETAKKMLDVQSKKTIPAIDRLRIMIQPLCYMLSAIAKEISKMDLNTNSEFDIQEAVWNRIKLTVDFEYRQPITMAYLSKKHHCSISYLSHLFKSRTGFSLRQYINALRMRDAIAYLVNTNMSISEIAYMTGFTDSNYFSTVFSREFDCSPSAYRQAKQESRGAGKKRENLLP